MYLQLTYHSSVSWSQIYEASCSSLQQLHNVQRLIFTGWQIRNLSRSANTVSQYMRQVRKLIIVTKKGSWDQYSMVFKAVISKVNLYSFSFVIRYNYKPKYSVPNKTANWKLPFSSLEHIHYISFKIFKEKQGKISDHKTISYSARQFGDTAVKKKVIEQVRGILS